jgi:hypothetical protein
MMQNYKNDIFALTISVCRFGALLGVNIISRVIFFVAETEFLNIIYISSSFKLLNTFCFLLQHFLFITYNFTIISLCSFSIGEMSP